MKSRLMAAVAVVAIVSATGVAKADSADELKALKAEAAALKKQNAALEKRLGKIEKQEAKTQAELASAPAARPSPSNFMADLASIKGGPALCAMPALDGPLTFCGITLFGTLDAGVGWASYGLPLNDKLYLGDNLINKYAQRSYFGVSPSNLAQTTVGIKGATELLPGVSGVFWASTGINPQSGQLSNAPGSQIDNNGLNRSAYSNINDGSRGGQAFNDQLYAGLSSQTFGQLTFGRHKSLTNDLIGAYDPAGGAYAFSVIGYSGTPVAGLGDTENGRWDDSLKYTVSIPVNESFKGRLGAMYKFTGGSGGCNYEGVATTKAGTSVLSPQPPLRCFTPNNTAGQADLGFTWGGFDFDGVLGYFDQATSTSALSQAQLVGPLLPGAAAAATSTFVPNWYTPVYGSKVYSDGINSNTLAGTVSDNTGFALAGKYTYQNWKFFAGWAHVTYHNPSNNLGVGATNDQGDYTLSSVNNAAFPHAKLLDTVWTGVKYALNSKTDLVGAFYTEHQNAYGWAAGTFSTKALSPFDSTSLATCSLPAYLPWGGKTYLYYGGAIHEKTQAIQSSPRSSTCSGNLYGVSGYVDYHFTKRFDVYAGLMYSSVDGGIQSGYFSANNWAPTMGARFTF